MRCIGGPGHLWRLVRTVTLAGRTTTTHHCVACGAARTEEHAA